MSSRKFKIIFIIIAGVAGLLVLIYLIVFGRALGQQEDHLAIAIALPKVILSSEPARIDEQTYLTKDTSSFIRLMENQGFTHIDQLGSGHVFEKDGKRYTSASRKYSSHLMIFTFPKEN